MRAPRPAPSAAELAARRRAARETLGIEVDAADVGRDLPVFGEGPPPEPDGIFSADELAERRRTFAVMLGIETEGK
jgi:hypothetical protein